MHQFWDVLNNSEIKSSSFQSNFSKVFIDIDTFPLSRRYLISIKNKYRFSEQVSSVSPAIMDSSAVLYCALNKH